MIRRALYPSILAAALCNLSSPVPAATDEQKQAVELLRVALECRPPVQQSNQGKTISQFRFIGDEDTLIVEVDGSSVWTPTKTQSPDNAGSQGSSMRRFAAKYADLDPKGFKAVGHETVGFMIASRCRNSELCAIELTPRHESCESRRDGQQDCHSGDESQPSINSSSAVFIKDICRSQFDNVTLALTTLHAAAMRTAPGKYAARPANILDAVPIREQPTTTAKVIGAIGSQSSPVNLTNCNGAWCQTKWGEYTGYVQRANFKETKK
ncbi:SH3 domain-containing protein [Bradyrhizobium sp. AS23.2]|uniref:SH3 domain-containing protein n=1 Tax=Bradyrhizobium sp. AS23.2 TaxID=1680155 RepID=UPI00093B2948|nr:SH3 domain-containing protein [Bradyrhizobium sp. AS23.2]OKO80967.1 hypothetical protein AC630_15015 [Bradyrhizobium sp. AS23.2]